ncbi:DinB family protein [Paenibacillus alkalitolerans]|uniref:DinB family protein n=1 Tax=Paenibacillus alkalitolerans TaxID=2799335 RepID=UPI0018F528BF|nr:DinB family protein [Paenibacillus alkalitolerans]
MSNQILTRQYEWIQRTREVLFDYCETVISATDYVKGLEQFGGASIRNLQAHVIDCYRFWLGRFALQRPLTDIRAESIENVQEMRKVYIEIDLLVNDFLNEFESQADLMISGRPSWQEEHIPLTPLWLFTHTITHEFHHKGQIVSMSRQLGYMPAVTDLYHETRP